MLPSTPGAGKATPGAHHAGDLAGAGQWLGGWENKSHTPWDKGAE